MGGFLGIGGSSAKTDRNSQLASQGNLNSVFNWALPQGQAATQQGMSTLTGAAQTLGPAQNYYQNLLTAGRTQTAANAAPAINATLAQADAARTQAGAFGTGRTGGATSAQAEAGSQTRASIDNTINQSMVQGRAAGAAGLQGVAGAQAGIGQDMLSTASSLLGLGTQAEESVMGNATGSRNTSNDINQQTQSQWGEVIAGLLGG